MSRPGLLRPLSIAGALALLGALSLPTAAAAAPGDDVLVFSHGDVVDRVDPGVGGGEYEWISDAIDAAGYNVTGFDGGDGQAATWATALNGIEVFVLPEQEYGPFYNPGSPPPWLSADAFDVLIDWIRAGGTMLFSGTCNNASASAYLLSQAVGVKYPRFLFDESCSNPDESTRWIGDTDLPSQLDPLSGTFSMNLALFSPQQRAPLTVWYTAPGWCYGEGLTVGEFTAGSGRIAFEAWDYYNDTDGDQAAWNEVLGSLLDGNAAASSWVPGEELPAPITAITASGQPLYTISESYCDSDQALLYRVDPSTALAAPIIGELIEGDPSQGATDPTTGISYLPFYDYDQGYLLLTVDTLTGEFTEVGAFSGDFGDLDGIEELYSLAIGADGSAYVLAEVWREDIREYLVQLFALDLSDASLTLIATIDDDLLDDPNGFAFNPVDGRYYAFEEDTYELFEVDVLTGGLTLLGTLDAPSIDYGFSDVTALQIAADGTFYVVWDGVYVEEEDEYGGMLASFTLADISGGLIAATGIGVLTDDVMESYSLLLGPAAAPAGLPATGAEPSGVVLSVAALLVLGLALIGIRRARRAA